MLKDADTTGRKRGSLTPAVITMIPGPRPANTKKRSMRAMKKCNHEECIHFMLNTTDDVACCNCCEDGSFFEEYKDEYTLADLGWNWW